MRNFTFPLFLLAMIVVATTPSIGASTATLQPSILDSISRPDSLIEGFAGVWQITVKETPIGSLDGEIDLKFETCTETYSGNITVYSGEFELQDLEVGDRGMIGFFILEPIGLKVWIQLIGTPNGPLKGKMHGRYPTTARRMKYE